MAVSASASGTFERPVFEGRVSLDGLELVTSPGETPIEGITGTLQLTPGRITTDDLSLRWNGNFGVAGALTLDGLADVGPEAQRSPRRRPKRAVPGPAHDAWRETSSSSGTTRSAPPGESSG